MKLLHERLKWAIKRKSKLDGVKISDADIARAAGVSATSASFWINGDNGISAAKARLLAAYLGVNAVWLETGEGIPDLIAGVESKQPKGEYQAPSGNQGSVITHHPDDGIDDEEYVYVRETTVYFSAGNGHHANYGIVEDSDPAQYRRAWFQKNRINPEQVRRFRVTGNSMEPMLYEGDAVLVNLAETHVIDGKMYAIRYGDDLRVKYLSKKIDGTLILKSLNPEYPPEEIPPSLVDEHISIIGRVRDASGTGGL